MIRIQTGGHWLWGHEKLIWETPNDSFYHKNVEELGSAIALKGACFGRDTLVITDPAALNHINIKMKGTDSNKPKNYYSNYARENFRRQRIEYLVGRGLPWSEGDEHRRERQLISPAFTHEQIKNMSGEIHGATQTFIDRLRNHLSSSKSEATVNMLHWTSAVTLDIIGIIGFGHDFQCGTSPESRTIRNCWSRVFDISTTFTGFIAPIALRTFPWLTKLSITFMKEQSEFKATVKTLAKEMVDNSAKAMPGDGETGKDLLSTLIRTTRATGEDLDRLLDHIVTFIFAGHETTSGTAAFSLFELARNPDIQARLRQEITGFEGSGPDGEPSYAEFQTKLPLLDAVCKETLRMYPVVSRLERTAAKDDVLPLRFPLITMPVIAANCDTTIWGPDAHVFRPQRWLEEGGLPPANSVVSGIGQLFTFGDGPRVCVGYRLAMFELKVILAALLRNFEFLPTGDRVEYMPWPTLQPYVVGKKEAGAQLPLTVKSLAA
ncbi:hypothetical protein FRB99_002791 [Tulasnella sp. 403]|nr:hypothetical protein FRB99_002791 [Tulasnella sp. 403]